MRPVNRIAPALPVQAYKTYAVLQPEQTHTRPATCAEAGCEHHENGWTSTFLAGSDDLDFVRRVCRGDVDGHRRRYVEVQLPDGFVQLVFEAGQACFRASTHRVSLERPPVCLVRGGDWRGDPTGARPFVHTTPESWVEDFSTHQAQLAEHLEG